MKIDKDLFKTLQIVSRATLLIEVLACVIIFILQSHVMSMIFVVIIILVMGYFALCPIPKE